MAEQIAWADRAAGQAPAAVAGGQAQLATSGRSSDTAAVVGRRAVAAIEQGPSGEAGGAAPKQLSAQVPLRAELPKQRGDPGAIVPVMASKQTPVHQRDAATSSQAAGVAAPCSAAKKTGEKHPAPPAVAASAGPLKATAHVHTGKHAPAAMAFGSRSTVRPAEAALPRSDSAGRVRVAADAQPVANGAVKQAAVEEGSDSLRRQGSPLRCPNPQAVLTLPAAATPGSIPLVLPKHEHHAPHNGPLNPVTEPRMSAVGAPGGADRPHQQEPLTSSDQQQVRARPHTGRHQLPACQCALRQRQVLMLRLDYVVATCQPRVHIGEHEGDTVQCHDRRRSRRRKNWRT